MSQKNTPRPKPLVIAITAVAIAIVAGIVITIVSVTQSVNRVSLATANGPSSDGVSVVAENSHVLDEAPDGKVTLVEFLDFECESCGALYPYVEQLREEYRGQITFVTRYFPIPAHQNSRTAAIAVEAAAQQDRFEEMYRLMFQTQGAWGERQASQAGVFRGYAERIGLDLAAYDAAVADPATLDRVLQDYDAGIALGVSSTPTFFLNGEKMEFDSLDGFRSQIAAALAE